MEGVVTGVGSAAASAALAGVALVVAVYFGMYLVLGAFAPP